MSVPLQIQVGGTAGQMLAKIDAGLIAREELHQDIATREESVVREYLQSLAQTRHKTADRLGAMPTGHLERAAESVSSDSDASGATVTVTSPGITRAFRDITITPGAGKKYLTIPATAEAYGKRAGAFSDLRLQFFGKGLMGLVKAEQSAIATRARSGFDTQRNSRRAPLLDAGRGDVYYWLKKSVKQKQDRTLLPSDATLQAAAEEGTLDWLRDFLGL